MWVVLTNHCQVLEELFQECCRLWDGKCAIPSSTRRHVQHCYIPQALLRCPKSWILRYSISILGTLGALAPRNARAVQMSVCSSAETSLCFMACSAQVVELESSCAWPCAQWAGAGGDGSSQMEDLRGFLGCASVPLILTPTAEHVFWNEGNSENCLETVSPLRYSYYKDNFWGIFQRLSPLEQK